MWPVVELPPSTAISVQAVQGPCCLLLPVVLFFHAATFSYCYFPKQADF